MLCSQIYRKGWKISLTETYSSSCFTVKTLFKIKSLELSQYTFNTADTMRTTKLSTSLHVKQSVRQKHHQTVTSGKNRYRLLCNCFPFTAGELSLCSWNSQIALSHPLVRTSHFPSHPAGTASVYTQTCTETAPLHPAALSPGPLLTLIAFQCTPLLSSVHIISIYNRYCIM